MSAFRQHNKVVTNIHYDRFSKRYVLFYRFQRLSINYYATPSRRPRVTHTLVHLSVRLSRKNEKLKKTINRFPVPRETHGRVWRSKVKEWGHQSSLSTWHRIWAFCVLSFLNLTRACYRQRHVISWPLTLNHKVHSSHSRRHVCRCWYVSFTQHNAVTSSVCQKYFFFFFRPNLLLKIGDHGRRPHQFTPLLSFTCSLDTLRCW